jgi:hypothetical protein
MNAAMHIFLRQLRKFSLAPSTLSELLLQIEEATTPVQLNRVVNRFQKAVWKLQSEEQKVMRQLAAQALMGHVLSASSEPLGSEAAGWLRVFVQAGMVNDPIPVFTTLVSAVVETASKTKAASMKVQHTYLKAIFDCFWSYRSPHPAYNSEAFPPNDIFYPLAALLPEANNEAQDDLFGIFAELPQLDDPRILTHLLPAALQWANSPDMEQRRRSIDVLRRMPIREAREALYGLQQDHDPLVRGSANNAAG